MINQVFLKVEGEIHNGWNEVSISMATNALCASFTLGIKKNRAIYNGQAAQILIDDELIMSGFVFQKSGGTNANSRKLSISGRDKTADLIDCSAIISPGSWRGQKLENIARDLCAPFNIDVIVKTETGAPFASFALEQGETVFEALSRIARLRGILLNSTANGDLILTRPELKPKTWALETGKNIHDISFDDDASERYSTYMVKGQHSYAGNISPKDAASAAATANDLGIIRYRPKLIISDEQSSKSGLQMRAEFEATAAAAKGQNVTIIVKSWRDPEGNLWALNSLIPIRDLEWEIDMAMMLSEITFNQNENSREAILKFVRPQSYTTEPLPEPKPETKKQSMQKAKTSSKTNAKLDSKSNKLTIKKGVKI